MQERLMSRRTLYYGSSIIHWECRSWESDPHKPEDDLATEPMSSTTYKQCFETLRRPLRPTVAVEDLAKFNWAWNKFLVHYTRGNLTKDEDRLIASAGMVEIVERSTGMTNISGLWKELLPEELLWQRVFEKLEDVETSQPQQQIAPSWSWASRNGPIGIPHRYRRYNLLKYFTQFVDYKSMSSTPTDQRCSQHSRGQIVVKGPIIEIIFPHIRRWCLERGHEPESKFYPEDPPRLHPHLVLDNGHCVEFYPDEPQLLDTLKSASLFCLLVARYQAPGEVGLVLAQILGSKSFRRVGYFIDYGIVEDSSSSIASAAVWEIVIE